MAEATAAEPDEGAGPQPRRPRRTHVINLCCAQSVQEVVEEVARNLRGLGFRVRVVCGAEARAALLGSRANSDQPMIHVVCVQGSLQERVLKPLRQALATHGGPNHHLFVAVLDLAVPLAMVGQIRRFAEALERPSDPTQPGPKGRVERRRWREHSPFRDAERVPSRSYPAVTQVVERPGTLPPRKAEGDGNDRPRRRTKSLTTRGRAARIGPTSKYRAVTASHQAVPPPTSGVSKRRRERSSIRPSAPVPGKGGRVLGAPPAKPPPPPAPGQMARRRSSTTLPAIRDDEPPPSAHPPEPDHVVTKTSPSLRFTPPAVKAAEVARTKSGRIVTAPPEGRDVSDTASTLRLDEPPFPELDEQLTTRYGQAEIREQIEAVAAAEEAKRAAEAPTKTETGTMVTANRDDPSASSTSGSLTASANEDEDEAPPPRRKTVLYQSTVSDEPEPAAPGEDDGNEASPRAEPDDGDEASARADEDADADDGATAPEDASSETNGEATAVSESAATLLRPSLPGRSDDDDDIAESDKTLLRHDGSFVTTRTLLGVVERDAETPQSADADDAEPEDTDTDTATPDTPEPKTASASPAEIESESASPADTDEPETPPPADDDLKMISQATRPPIKLDPEDREDEPPKKKTVLYAEAERPDADDRDGDDDPADSMKATVRRVDVERDDEPSSDSRISKTARAEPEAAAATAPAEERRGGRGWVWLVLLLLLGAGGFGAYQAGLLDGMLGRSEPEPTIAANEGGTKPSTDDAEAASAASSEGLDPRAAASEDGSMAAAGTTSAIDPSDGSTGVPASASTGAELGPTDDGEPAAGTTGGADPTATATTGADPAAAETTGGADPTANETTGPSEDPEPTTTSAADPEPADAGPRLTPEEEILAAAADERRVTMLKTLFVSKKQGGSTTWIGGNSRCSALEVDGVGGWRLPHRREMKLINVVLRLPQGIYWTFTVPKDDRKAAYVLDTDTNGLSLFLKQEPTGEVLCVRRRQYPDED